MTNGTAKRVCGLVLRLLLGALFVVSALAKLWSIDQFELYVFSYGFFPLNITFILVRLCIGAELALGVLLLAGWWRRLTLLAALALLLAFSLFLCYAALAGRNDSCQCMGQLADMPPALSLLKNAVLIALTLLCIKLSAPWHGRRLHHWLAAALVAAAMAVPFVVSVPDSWMFGSSEERYDAAALAEAMEGPLAEHRLDEGAHVVAFVTPGCPYCRMARQKLDYIAQRHHLPDGYIVYLEPSDLGNSDFLRITYGARPLILLMQDGKVAATFHYRNIDERKVARQGQ